MSIYIAHHRKKTPLMRSNSDKTLNSELGVIQSHS